MPKNHNTKTIIDVPQGGLAVCSTEDSVVFQMFDISFCIGLVLENNTQVVATHVDSNTDLHAIQAPLKEIFKESPPQKAYLIHGHTTYINQNLGRSSQSVQHPTFKKNLGNITNVLKNWPQLTITVIKNVYLDKSETVKFAYEVLEKKFVQPSGRSNADGFIEKIPLIDKLTNAYFCRSSLIYFYRAVFTESPPLLDATNLIIPITAKQLQILHSLIPKEIRAQVSLTAPSTNRNNECCRFFIYLEDTFVALAKQIMIEVFKKTGKHPDVASINAAATAIFIWALNSPWCYKLHDLNSNEKSQLNTILSTAIENSLQKNNIRRQVSQVFAYSNLFFGCSSYHIDIEKLGAELPNTKDNFTATPNAEATEHLKMP